MLLTSYLLNQSVISSMLVENLPSTSVPKPFWYIFVIFWKGYSILSEFLLFSFEKTVIPGVEQLWCKEAVRFTICWQLVFLASRNQYQWCFHFSFWISEFTSCQDLIVAWTVDSVCIMNHVQRHESIPCSIRICIGHAGIPFHYGNMQPWQLCAAVTAIWKDQYLYAFHLIKYLTPFIVFWFARVS